MDSEHNEPPPGLAPGSKLCSHCQSMFDHWSQVVDQINSSFLHWETVDELKSSATAGCALCTQFLLDVPQDVFSDAEDRLRNLPTQKYVPSCGIVSIHPGSLRSTRSKLDCLGWYLVLTYPFTTVVPFEEAEPQNHALSLSMHPRKDKIEFFVEMIPDMCESNRKPLGSLLSSKYSLPLAAEWLQECREYHGCCNQSRVIFPSRVLQVGLNNVRLRLAAEICKVAGRYPPYATLSHCWGSLKIETLVSKNLNQFRQSIPAQAIPKTFVDAIGICRQLGIQYLWIDSLCIIQNDAEDWKRESSLMTRVYGNSYLNIAASGAEDGKDGCFFDRKQTWRCQVHLNIPQIARNFTCASSNFYWRVLGSMPLLRRGWALQERLLAPRTLHCTSSELFWECQGLRACESFPDSFPQQLTKPSNYLQKPPVSKNMWSWIAQRYSGCLLSYSSDKLIAISGVAQHIQLQTHDQYYAGLWREDLEHQLCWSAEISGSGKRIIPYEAPSWSWASIDGSIKCCKDWLYTPGFLSIKTLDVTVLPPGTGSVSEAKIRLSCMFLFQGSIMVDKRKTLGGKYQGHKGHVADFAPPRGDSIPFVVFFDTWCDLQNSMETVYVLPVDGYGSHDKIVGLLLAPTLAARGQYRRMGIFATTQFEDANEETELFEASTKQFELSTQEPACQVSIADCVELCEDENGIRYVIDLV